MAETTRLPACVQTPWTPLPASAFQEAEGQLGGEPGPRGFKHRCRGLAGAGASC